MLAPGCTRKDAGLVSPIEGKAQLAGDSDVQSGLEPLWSTAHSRSASRLWAGNQAAAGNTGRDSEAWILGQFLTLSIVHSFTK